MPALHFSSFEAGEGLRIPMPDPDAEDRALYGFIQQAEQVAVGANAIIERAVMEGLSTVVEGVHLVPGLVAPERHHDGGGGAGDARHQRRGRPPGAFHAARLRVRRYPGDGSLPGAGLARSAGFRTTWSAGPSGTGVPVIEAGDMNAALVDVIDLILERAGGANRRARLGPWRFRQ